MSACTARSTTLQYRITVGTAITIASTDYIILKIDPSALGVPLTEHAKVTSFTGGTGAGTLQYFKHFEVYRLTGKSITAATLQLTTSPATLNAGQYTDYIRYAFIQVHKNTLESKYQRSSSFQLQLDAFTGQPASPAYEILNLGATGAYDNVQSTAKLLVKFNSFQLPAGSNFVLDLGSNLPFTCAREPIYYSCALGRTFVPRDDQSSLECFYVAPNKYQATGFAEVADGTTVWMIIYATIFKSVTNSKAINSIAFYHSATNLITTYSDTTTTINTDADLNAGTFQPINHYTVKYIWAQEWGAVDFTFMLYSHDIDSASTDNYVKVALPALNVMGAASPFLWQAAATREVNYFIDPAASECQIRAPFTVVGQECKINAQASYTIEQSVEHRVNMDTHYAASGNNGVQRPAPGMYRFWLSAFQSSSLGTPKEVSYHDFIVEPKPDTGFDVKPLLLGNNLETTMRFKYTTGIALDNTYEIWLEFQTHNGNSNVFLADLGLGMGASETQREIDCSETVAVISADTTYNGQQYAGAISGNAATRIRCYLFKGNQLTAVPAIVKIPVENPSLASGTSLDFYISKIKNPQTAVLAIVRLSLRKQCRNDKLMCMQKQSTSSYQVISQPSIVYSLNSYTYPSQTHNCSQPSPTATTLTNQDHQHNLNIEQTMNTSDWILFKYNPGNHRLQSTCYTTDNSFCMVFPQNSYILYKPAAPIAQSKASIYLPQQIRSVVLRGMK